jgi:hypothetical protein
VRRLYGNHIDTASGSWVLSDGGIGNISLIVAASFSLFFPFSHTLNSLAHVRFAAGTNSDSFIEYLAKGQQAARRLRIALAFAQQQLKFVCRLNCFAVSVAL